MGRADLCGLDDGQVVDTVESGAHWRSESCCAKGHAAKEPHPQLVPPARRHQGCHLGPGPAVLPAITGNVHQSLLNTKRMATDMSTA